MQKDFMGMAQGQQQTSTPNVEDLDQELEKVGLPGGNTAEDAKKRILILLEESGFLKTLNPSGLQKLTQKIDEFLKLAEAGDLKALENHEITKIFKKIEEQAQMPQQGQEQPAATKDFASMMPPSGGGLPGR